MENLQTRLADVMQARTRLKDRFRIVTGDHWRDGDGWVGPTPTGTDAAAQKVIAEIRRAFVVRNVIAEALERHATSVTGRDVRWDLDPQAPNLTTPLTRWWDEQQVLDALHEATLASLWAGEDAGKASAMLRVYVPDSMLVDGQVPKGRLDEVLRYLKVHAPPPLSSGMLRDTDDEPIAGFYRYRDDEDEREYTEVTTLARHLDESTIQVLEGLDQGYNHAATPPDTTLVLLQTEQTPVAFAAYQLGGRLTMHELRRPPLLTNAAITQQDALNMTLTMMSRNVVLGGFLERVITNAQMPGKFVDADGNEVPSGSENDPGVRFAPDPVNVGGGSLNFLAGLPLEDERGNVQGYTSPQVIYRDPVATDTFIGTSLAAKRGILEELYQVHTEIAGDATASGRSRQQAMKDFENSIARTGKVVEAATRWMVEAALAMASVFEQAPGRYDAHRATADVRLATAVPDAEDVQTTLALRNGALISRETALERVGIEDTDAELERLKNERDAAVTPPPREAGENDPAEAARAGRRVTGKAGVAGRATAGPGDAAPQDAEGVEA